MPSRKRTCAPSDASCVVRDVGMFCAWSITTFTVAPRSCIAHSRASTTGFALDELEMLKFDTRIVPPCFTSWIAATSILIITLRGAIAVESIPVQARPQPGLLKMTYDDGHDENAGGCHAVSGNIDAFGFGRSPKPPSGRT